MAGLLGLTLGGAVPAIGASGEPAPRFRVMSADRNLAADHRPATGQISCPRGFRIASGGFEVRDPDYDTGLASRSAGVRRWRSSAVRSSARSRDSSLTTYGVCVKNSGVVIAKRRVDYPDPAIPATLDVECPPGLKPIGGGGGFTEPTSSGRILESLPHGRGWRFSARQAGTGVLRAEVLCTTDLHLTLVSRVDGLPADAVWRTSRVTCPRGTRAVGGGGGVSGPVDWLLGSFPTGRRSWVAVGLRPVFEPTPGELIVAAICARR